MKHIETNRNPAREAGEDVLLTVSELAAYLKLSISAIHKLTYKRKLPFYRPGGRMILFRKSQIDAWLEGHKQTANNDNNASNNL
jgi:excisionase family DNA binding protein